MSVDDVPCPATCLRESEILKETRRVGNQRHRAHMQGEITERMCLDDLGKFSLEIGETG